MFSKPYVDAFSDDEGDDDGAGGSSGGDDGQHGNFQASLSARADNSSASATDHLSPIPTAQAEVRELSRVVVVEVPGECVSELVSGWVGGWHRQWVG